MATSMRTTYFEGLAQALLQGRPGITGVETYAEAGIVGEQWTPTGLKVTTEDGRVVLLSVVRGSSTSVDAAKVEELPDTYTQ